MAEPATGVGDHARSLHVHAHAERRTTFYCTRFQWRHRVHYGGTRVTTLSTAVMPPLPSSIKAFYPASFRPHIPSTVLRRGSDRRGDCILFTTFVTRKLACKFTGRVSRRVAC
jgi:hypothetical protein